MNSAAARGDAARFEQQDLAPGEPGLVQQGQRHLRGLARAGRRFEHGARAAGERREQGREDFVDRKGGGVRGVHPHSLAQRCRRPELMRGSGKRTGPRHGGRPPPQT